MYIPPEQLLHDYSVLSVELGDRSYGLGTMKSNVEHIHVFAAPTAAFWGFDKPVTQVETSDNHRGWEIERFLQLALAGDPVAIECLWSPVIARNDIGDGLVTLRPYLVSRLVYRSFVSRANSQIDRLAGGSNWDSAMHMLRLLISLDHLLKYSEPLIEVGKYRDHLLAVGQGKTTWSQIHAWRDQLASKAQDALSSTQLPPRPDREVADRFLIEARRRMV